jgi:hypothetical protein
MQRSLAWYSSVRCSSGQRQRTAGAAAVCRAESRASSDGLSGQHRERRTLRVRCSSGPATCRVRGAARSRAHQRAACRRGRAASAPYRRMACRQVLTRRRERGGAGAGGAGTAGGLRRRCARGEGGADGAGKCGWVRESQRGEGFPPVGMIPM